jgi:hypothetical protein
LAASCRTRNFPGVEVAQKTGSTTGEVENKMPSANPLKLKNNPGKQGVPHLDIFGPAFHMAFSHTQWPRVKENIQASIIR